MSTWTIICGAILCYIGYARWRSIQIEIKKLNGTMSKMSESEPIPRVYGTLIRSENPPTALWYESEKS